MRELYTLFIRRPFIFEDIKYRLDSDLLILGALHKEIQYKQNFVWAWAESVKLKYPGKIQTRQNFSGIFKVSSIARWKCQIHIIFLIDLNGTYNMLSPDYSLNIFFFGLFSFYGWSIIFLVQIVHF